MDERVAFALRTQLLEWRAALALGAERVGWKVGRGIIPEPLIGHLTSATRLRRGGVYRVGEARDLRADAELAIEIGMAGEPIRYGAAMELVDFDASPEDFERVVAANLFHRAYAFAPLRREPPPELVRAEVRVNGAVAGTAERPVDPAETARIVEELLGAAGERLEPRDRIICGSIVQIPVTAGAEVVVDLGELGQVAVKLR